MLIEAKENGERIALNSPTKLPQASSFLWNKKMMIHINCRGYAVAQYMNPEPAKYAYMPNLEAKTFMQPEQPYFTHHPGRFVYIKDEETGEIFSAPHEPVKKQPDRFEFSAGKGDIKWVVTNRLIEVEMTLRLPLDEPLELWSIKVTNRSKRFRKMSIYTYFPMGYMSWMNQSGKYDEKLGGVVASCITPYQKYQDYAKIKELKDKTFLLSDIIPDAWEVNQSQFEGEGGLHNPTGLQQEWLEKGDAIYETPAGVLQFRTELSSAESKHIKLLFGPAKDEQEIAQIRKKYFAPNGFSDAELAYKSYLGQGKATFQIKTPDAEFDNFVNHWLPRQIYYHGETNRLCTDPQTRNYLQDNMGMSYIKPELTKKAFLTALSQQASSGAMPDGILIVEGAELKYINQVPHTDHCVWLSICLKAYLDETNDYALLDERLSFAGGDEVATVSEHIRRAMHWLVENRDERGLNYINQGDWCDPMNMVGYKGKGVSGWLSMATSYALQTWSDICETNGDASQNEELRAISTSINNSINTHLWDGNWYGRGITDDNVVFGISQDKEGKIFLNAQGWAMLSQCADSTKREAMIKAIETHLESPYGVEMLAPSFTSMREDVGRVTQKFPGSAENGSIYNHATAFYIFALYTIGEADSAFKYLRKMIPGPDEADVLQRGQLPVFIPNYYRGAHKQYPRTAGRSSQLFNTGTVHWVYRCLIDGMLGLQGTKEGLKVDPKLPSDWNEIEVVRHFRGAIFNVKIVRNATLKENTIVVNGKALVGSVVTLVEKGKTYDLSVNIP